MTRNRTGFTALLLSVALLLSMSSAVNAQKKMTYEQFLTELQANQARLEQLNQEIDGVKAEIERLKAEIARVDDEITATWDKIYAAVGTTEEEVAAEMDNLSAIEARLKELSGMPPDALMGCEGELNDILNTITYKMAGNLTKLTMVKEFLSGLDTKTRILIKSIPKPKHDNYSVISGDCLWFISKKPVVYGDPWKWMRIYSANRSQIKNPDLIYKGQVFRIPRTFGSDEHLVIKGEYLSKIAGYNEVYGDPFQWTKIYQANKAGNFIKDPNLIYPEQILVIPNN